MEMNKFMARDWHLPSCPDMNKNPYHRGTKVIAEHVLDKMVTWSQL